MGDQPPQQWALPMVIVVVGTKCLKRVQPIRRSAVCDLCQQYPYLGVGCCVYDSTSRQPDMALLQAANLEEGVFTRENDGGFLPSISVCDS